MKKSQKGFTLLVAVVLLALVVGVGAYYYKTVGNDSGVELGNVPQNEVASNGSVGADNSSDNNINEGVVGDESISVSVKTNTNNVLAVVDNRSDCGVSETLKGNKPIDQLTADDFESDDTLVCMGKNMINICFSSKAKVYSGSREVDFSIKSIYGDCEINLKDQDNNKVCLLSKTVPLKDGKIVGSTPLLEANKQPGSYAFIAIMSCIFN